MKLVHSNSSTKVFWYLNRTFIGSTLNIHEIEVFPKIGEHQLKAIDKLGNEVIIKIEIKD